MPVGTEPPTLYLLTVLLKNGTTDGDPRVAQEMQDSRLGQKIQILRTLRILEREGPLPKDLKTIKSHIVSALDTGDVEARITLNELKPTLRTDRELSDDLRNGLQWGREKMLRRLEVIEQVPTEYRDQALREFRERSHKLFARL